MDTFLLHLSLTSLWSVILDIAIKAAILTGCAMLVALLLGKNHVLARAAVWNACVISLALLPFASLAFPRVRIECLPSFRTESHSTAIPAVPETIPLQDLRT